jgi:hypothetical protein
MAEPILVAKRDATECFLLPALANRHGLITGATGTGKTITLQTMAERFSRLGVPVFMADVKGDLTGISQKGTIGDKMAAVLKERKIDLPPSQACPATLARRDHDLADHPRPDLAALLVLPALAVLDVGPLGMTRHRGVLLAGRATWRTLADFVAGDFTGAPRTAQKPIDSSATALTRVIASAVP